MELINDFRVSVPVERAWEVLTDLERIAPCMPGAQLQEVEGHVYRGVVKVKVGPITAQYKGTATFVERDDAAHRAVLRAEGRDTRGQGNASATITATLTPEGDATHVRVVTDLTVSGKVAQFGRGVLVDVSAKLLDQFVAALEHDVLTGPDPTSAPTPAAAPKAAEPAKPAAPVEMAAETPTTAEPAAPAAPAPAAPAAPAPAAEPEKPAVRTIQHREAAPVDLLQTAGSPVAKRVAPVAAVVAILWLLRVFLRRRKR
jgi:carbon monoxide dehydrogenase subunit G